MRSNRASKTGFSRSDERSVCIYFVYQGRIASRRVLIKADFPRHVAEFVRIRISTPCEALEFSRIPLRPMSRIKDKPIEKPRRADPARNLVSEPANPSAWSRTVRETIESVVIAFVLAFLFRTFEAEAFVIPTGSMAPTLMGRHMDLKCPKCGYRFQVGGPDD